MINVVCGLILCNHKILVAQNPPTHKYAHLWELPGGKMEENETPFEAIIREFEEELALCVTPLFAFDPLPFPALNISLQPILCHSTSSVFQLLHHIDAKWIDFDQIDRFDWAPTDRVLMEQVKTFLYNLN